MDYRTATPIRLRASDKDALEAAGRALGRGELVVFPTETYYGLAARADRHDAVARLAAVKERPTSQPLPVIAASVDLAQSWADIPDALKPLAAALWPGPLTLAVSPRSQVPEALVGTNHTLGLRVSSHPIAEALARGAGGIITATSANLRGGLAPVSVQALDAALTAQVAVVLDDGETPGGAASTVVGVARGKVVVLREGATPREAIARALGYFPA